MTTTMDRYSRYGPTTTTPSTFAVPRQNPYETYGRQTDDQGSEMDAFLSEKSGFDFAAFRRKNALLAAATQATTQLVYRPQSGQLVQSPSSNVFQSSTPTGNVFTQNTNVTTQPPQHPTSQQQSSMIPSTLAQQQSNSSIPLSQNFNASMLPPGTREFRNERGELCYLLPATSGVGGTSVGSMFGTAANTAASAASTTANLATQGVKFLWNGLGPYGTYAACQSLRGHGDLSASLVMPLALSIGRSAVSWAFGGDKTQTQQPTQMGQPGQFTNGVFGGTQTTLTRQGPQQTIGTFATQQPTTAPGLMSMAPSQANTGNFNQHMVQQQSTAVPTNTFGHPTHQGRTTNTNTSATPYGQPSYQQFNPTNVSTNTFGHPRPTFQSTGNTQPQMQTQPQSLSGAQMSQMFQNWMASRTAPSHNNGSFMSPVQMTNYQPQSQGGGSIPSQYQGYGGPAYQQGRILGEIPR